MIINTKSCDFPLRYVEIPTEQIFNWLDPVNITAKWACKAIAGDWWSDRNVSIRKYFASAWTKEYDRLTGHFTNLESSIKEKGILSPVLTMSGPPRGTYLKPHHFYPHMQPHLSQAIATQTFGGSRVTIAQKLGIKNIPCAVMDYANLFPSEPMITEHNFDNWFGEDFFFTGGNIPIRCMSMTQDVRKAQSRSADVARAATYAKFGLMDPIS